MKLHPKRHHTVAPLVLLTVVILLYILFTVLTAPQPEGARESGEVTTSE